MTLRIHLIVVFTVIVAFLIAREFVHSLPCPDDIARYCVLGQKVTDVFLIVYSSGLIITLTAYFFFGFSRAWSYIKTYLFALATYVITIPIYFLLATFLVPLIFKQQISIK